MTLRKRSYAFFLLILFSVVAFHDLLPHVHHDHNDHAETTHHEDHDHDHEHYGALDLIGHALQLHHHHHNDCEVDVCPEVPVVKQENRDKDQNVQAVIGRTTSNDIGDAVEASLDWSEVSKTNKLLESMTQRGPPKDC